MALFIVIGTIICLTSILARLLSRWSLLDYPNDRSLHSHPTPRTGGLAILGGLCAGGVWLAGNTPTIPLFLTAILTSLLPLVIISLLDDRYGISARWRILVHFWTAVSLLLIGFTADPLHPADLVWPLAEGVVFFLSLLFVVWMINLYNFMDGMDGFAGGMAVIGFSTLAWLGRADDDFMNICLMIAAASAGFLLHNFPPAKIFMGDIGSTLLGFLAAACSLWGSKTGLFPFWAALLVFSPFIVDATLTLLRRLWRGEKVWQAHRTHYYQRLVLLGWGHRWTVLAEYGLMLACAGSAVFARLLSPTGQWSLIVGWVLIYGLLMLAVGWLERRHATVSAP